VLVLHHPPKTGGGVRGGSAILASADYVLEIERVQDRSAIRELRLTKARDAETKKLGAFVLTPVILGQDTRGRDITTCFVEASEHTVYSGRQPPHFDIFIGQSFEWARADEEVRDVDPVAVETLRRAFMDVMKGRITEKAAERFFRECKNFAVDNGMVELVGEIDNPYIKELAVNVIPPDAERTVLGAG
jgi:hypothetical protein